MRVRIDLALGIRIRIELDFVDLKHRVDVPIDPDQSMHGSDS